MRRGLMLAACAAVVALAGCAHTVVADHATCVPLKTYSAAEQAAASAQLKALAAVDPAFLSSPVASMISDYKAMRDADRACIGR